MGRFQVLTTADMKMTVSWDVSLSNLVEIEAVCASETSIISTAQHTGIPA